MARRARDSASSFDQTSFGLFGLAGLFGRHADVEARLRKSGIEGERALERLHGVRRHLALVGEDEGFAEKGLALRRRAHDADGLAPGLGGVAEAADAHVDRRDDFVAAAIVGVLGQMRLDLGDGGHDVHLLGRRGAAGEQRLVRIARRADEGVEPDSRQRDGRQRDDGGRAAGALSGRPPCRGSRPPCQQPAGSFRPGGLGFLLVDDPALQIARDARGLGLVERDVGLGPRHAGGRAGARQRQEHAHGGGGGESGEYDPDHRRVCVISTGRFPAGIRSHGAARGNVHGFWHKATYRLADIRAPDAMSACSRTRQPQRRLEAAQSRILQLQRAAVDLGEVGDDGQAEARAGLGLVEAPARARALLRAARPAGRARRPRRKWRGSRA